ncbi:MAG TPA: hypothetical protein VGI59_06330, partial [Candidatus Udaeobacter sp.]
MVKSRYCAVIVRYSEAVLGCLAALFNYSRVVRRSSVAFFNYRRVLLLESQDRPLSVINGGTL